MTVLEYVRKHNLDKFYCEAIGHIVLTHKHLSRRGNISTRTTSFIRQNLCHIDTWRWYESFSIFSNKEVVEILNKGSIPIIQVAFTKEDWEREAKSLFLESERDYDYCFYL